MKKVTTESGSVYTLDLDKMIVCRTPSKDAPNLRKDDYDIPILKIFSLEVGRMMNLMIQIRDDGVPTVRVTSPVVSIEEV